MGPLPMVSAPIAVFVMTIEIRAAPIKAQALEVPRRIRAWVRAREAGTVVLAAIVGAIAGLVVTVMGGVVSSLHELFFQIGNSHH